MRPSFVCFALLVLAAPSRGDVLLFEDFEELALSSYTSPTTFDKGDGTDWTANLPPGWAMEYIGPVGDPIEFQGWHVHDVDSWIAQQSDQQRSTWSHGGVGSHGNVLVADPDAYDDGTDVDGDFKFNTMVTTPPLDLAGLPEGSVALDAESFFRGGYTTILRIDVTYDAGLVWHLVAEWLPQDVVDDALYDEHLHFIVGNPSTGTLRFRFAMFDAGNDWWWALDDVRIATPEPDPAVAGAFACAALSALGRRSPRPRPSAPCSGDGARRRARRTSA